MTTEVSMPNPKYYGTLPEGNYALVTYDIMTTGSSLNDDLCSISAYCPDRGLHFTQHILPCNNLSLGACRRYSLRIISNGRYRVLKDVRNNQVLETKSEYMALLSFIDFLRLCVDVTDDTTDGLILMAHDSRKFFSSLLMEVIVRANLVHEFCALVKGFANSYAIAEVKCAKPGRSLSLRTLATSLEVTDSGHPVDLSERAKTAYLLVKHIFQKESIENGSEEPLYTQDIIKLLHPFTITIEGVDEETEEIRKFRRREESLLPLFSKMRSNRNDRQRSFILLRLLAHSNIDYAILHEIHEKGGIEAINEVLRCTLDKEHMREIDELKHVFALHFDPEYKGEFKPDSLSNPSNGNGNKQQQGPGGRRFFRRRNSNKKNSTSSGRNNSESQPGSPTTDDGATTPPVAITIPSDTTAIAAV